MKKMLFVSAAATAMAGVSFAQSADMPPSADPGECFARVLIPETTEILTEQVIDRPESTEITVIPATYETVTEQVLVKEETVEIRVVPATYETVTEQVLIEPERTETVVVPATFETYTEEVLVRPAYSTWKPGAGLYGRGAAGTGAEVAPAGYAQSTGELLCRVEVPAQYDTVTRTRLATPESTDTRVIPARYETVTKQIVVEPARTVEEVIPAVYDTVTVERLVTATREETTVIPATYKTVEKRVVTGGGGLEWREVLCDTNASPSKISEVQQALNAAGYTNPVDGAFGPATLTAMESYQRANGLPVGYLTVSTVESLGVSPF
ncbi:MAG: peptidoglycan-binding domain-containing protein [Pseudomonadota bacterium]